MINEGWIKVHRKIKYGGLFKNPRLFTLWMWLLLTANRKPEQFMWNDGLIHIKEGQLLTGRDKLSDALGIPHTTVDRLLDELEKMGNIGQQKTTKFRVITILNWSKYQEYDKSGQQTGNRRATDGHKQDYRSKKIDTKVSTEAKPLMPNRAINEVISYLKGKLGVSRLDGSEAGNRRFAHLMLKKIGGNEHEAAEGIKKIIDAGLSDNFHRKNMMDFKYIYYNAMKIIASHKLGDTSGPKWRVVL